jgi:hypothetical protein
MINNNMPRKNPNSTSRVKKLRFDNTSKPRAGYNQFHESPDQLARKIKAIPEEPRKITRDYDKLKSPSQLLQELFTGPQLTELIIGPYQRGCIMGTICCLWNNIVPFTPAGAIQDIVEFEGSPGKALSVYSQDLIKEIASLDNNFLNIQERPVISIKPESKVCCSCFERRADKSEVSQSGTKLGYIDSTMIWNNSGPLYSTNIQKSRMCLCCGSYVKAVNFQNFFNQKTEMSLKKIKVPANCLKDCLLPERRVKLVIMTGLGPDVRSLLIASAYHHAQRMLVSARDERCISYCSC